MAIKHWLVFMALAGVGFALYRLPEAGSRLPLSFAIVSAAAITGALVLMLNRDSQGRFLRASGHWLVALQAMHSLFLIPLQMLVPPNLDANTTDTINVLFHGVLALMMATAAIFNQRGWRWMFGLRSGIETCRSVIFFFLSTRTVFPLLKRLTNVTDIVSLVLSIVMFVAAVREVSTRAERDWGHLLGISMVCYAIMARTISLAGG